MTGSITDQLQANNRRAFSCAGGLIDSARPTDPVYLFCSEKLSARAQRFLQGFQGPVSYAVKANPEPRILQTLARSGIRHFDVASLEEVRTVLTLCPDARIRPRGPGPKR